MADLPTIADRINDIEVSANAPLSESVNRRYGSNINFILDFLGVSDGETSPTGTLSDLSQAVALADSHTMDLQLNITANGLFSIGTFTQPKFLNQVFYLFADGGQSSKVNIEWRAAIGDATKEFPLINVDAGGNEALNPGVNEPSSFGHDFNYTQPSAYYTNAVPSVGDVNSKRFSKVLNGGADLIAQTATIGPAVQTNILLPIIELDYRDPGTNFELLINISDVFGIGAGSTAQIYREYKLNVGSFGF